MRRRPTPKIRHFYTPASVADVPLDLAADDPIDRPELRHEIRLGVQSAGRIDDQDIRPASIRGLGGVERHGCRIAALLSTEKVRTDARRPDLQLLDRCCAERV